MNLQLGSRRGSEDDYSLNRLLDSNLHLVVKLSDKWMLPETELVQGESLRQVGWKDLIFPLRAWL